MNTFRKVNGEWVVSIFATATTGDTIPVNLRNGGTKQVTLGEPIGNNCFKVAPAPARASAPVGDLSGINAMFDRARQHLRHPAIVLDGFRVNVAGPRAKHPGSLNVTSIERTTESRFGGLDREWYGRVTVAGQFEPGRNAPADLANKLRAFAADPAGEAARYGRLHGACCFCSIALRDERSTAVGYGPTCADHYGLPWGARVCEAA